MIPVLTEQITSRKRVEIIPPPGFVPFLETSICQGLHQRFEQQVEAYPANVAVKTTSATWTYSELNALANTIAAAILSLTGTELAQVGLLLPNSQNMIAALLACMKAHKVYVPLDTAFPKARLDSMLEDASPVLLIAGNDSVQLAAELSRGGPILNIDELALQVDAANPGLVCDPLERAYILYTSGSTGRPKGMQFLHRNLLHSTMCLTNQLCFSPSDRVTWLHSASFAASVVDIYCALTNGAGLYAWDAKRQGFTGLANWLQRERITTFQWIPSAFRQFLRNVPEDTSFENIRLVVMASEPLTVREMELFRRRFPRGSRLVNQLGTSESYNYCLYPIDHETRIDTATVPGGYPVSADREVLILDDDHNAVARGQAGEIAVRSRYMSAGYWQDEELTSKKFIALDESSAPVYLTGDLGRIESDGCLIHLGRKDSQVKLRGYRIELAEIDHCLSRAPGVADCAVAMKKNRAGEDALVAYVVVNPSGSFQEREVTAHLSARLPGYMLPNRYMLIDSLPTLPAGKVDRTALPNPFESSAVPDRLRTMAAEMLDLDHVSEDLNLLQAGADSLATATLMARVETTFGVEVSMHDFAPSPTLENLARIIRQPWRTQEEDAPRNLVIVSAGKFGRETLLWAEEAVAAGARMTIKGFLDSRPDALSGYHYSAPILGGVHTYAIQPGDVFLCSIGSPIEKLRYCAPLLNRGACFLNLLHPKANIARTASLGTGVLIAPFTSVNADASVGDHVSIGTHTNVGHDVRIENWCQVASHCAINGNAVVEEGAFIGSQACILPGVRIGAWSYIGAGSVVLQDVPPETKVFGNPAAIIGRIE